MGIQGILRWVVALLVLQLYISAAKAQGLSLYSAHSDLNVTSRLEDYIIQNQRQYDAVILSFEQQIAQLRTDYLNQANTIEVQRQQIEIQQLLIDERLNPLELLSDLSKHCVQKYRAGLVTVASVKTTLTNCLSSATSYVASVTSALEQTMRNLNNYYIGTHKVSIANCAKVHAASSQNYTKCVTQIIYSTNTVTKSYQETFATQLESSTCSGNSRLQASLKCSFNALYSTITTIGRVTSSIDDCISGVNACQPCDEGATCSNLLYMDPASVDFKNETIPNPFYGFKANITCVHVEFSDVPV